MADQQRANMLDILRHEVENSGTNFNVFYTALKKGIESGKTRILRYGNTLLVYIITNDGVAKVHIYSMDTPQKMMEAAKNFYEAFKVAKFKTLIAETDNSQIVRMLQMLGIPIQVKQKLDGGNVAYQIVCEVK